jgi:hypothetical protein
MATALEQKNDFLKKKLQRKRFESGSECRRKRKGRGVLEVNMRQRIDI